MPVIKPARRPRIGLAVITGGRPLLSDRPTAALLPAIAEGGFDYIEWVVREDHADAYERDDFPLNVYPTSFDDEYSRTHWRHPTAVWKPGGFHGAFTGREWAMRTGEQRGVDLIFQLDDNVKIIGPISAKRAAAGGIYCPAKCLAIAAELALSTNGMMVGLQLDSVVPRTSTRLIRPGFPYSVFAEKPGRGRMSWFGPFEDDIMHAMEYGLHGGPARTAAVIETLRYAKVSGGTGGMRKHYDTTRGLELIRRYPRNAKLVEGSRTSSPMDRDRGVRHYLNSRGFTPVTVTDPDRFAAARGATESLAAAYLEAVKARAKAKIRNRAGIIDV